MILGNPAASLVGAQARMEMLGLRRAKRELAEIVAASAPPRRPRTHKQYAVGPPRRSARLSRHAVQHKMLPLAGCLGKVTAVPVEDSEKEEEDAAAAVDEEMAPAMQESHCVGEVRVAVDDPVLGVSCHLCRQRKSCGEEDCKRCVGGDLNLPCIVKTGCSSCHSSIEIICHACLKVRYGEELKEVGTNWMCSYCIDEKASRSSGHATEDDEEEDDVPEPMPLLPAKRGRGRPPKARPPGLVAGGGPAAVGAVLGAAANPAAAPRRRGRPPKPRDPHAPPKVPRPRGRPRKNPLPEGMAPRPRPGAPAAKPRPQFAEVGFV